MGNFANFAKIFLGSYFGKGIVFGEGIDLLDSLFSPSTVVYFGFYV